MTNKEKEILEAFLSKTLNLGGEAISGLFNTEGELIDLKIAEDADASRVAKLKTEKQNEFNKGLEKGASRIEKLIKEKYQIESDLLGVELVDHLIESQTTELTEKLKSKGKDDDFEKHPKYIEFKKAHESQLKAKDKEWEEKVNQKESEWTRKETLNKVAKLAFTELETGYVLPENATRANALKEVLQRELEAGNYKVDESDEPILLDKEGIPLQDDHGNMIKFKEHVNNLAGKYFDKKVANQRGNAGNNNQQQQQTGVFKTKEEYLEAARNAKTPEEGSKVLQIYKNSNLV